MSSQTPDKEPLTGKAATQDRILEAATHLFIEQGYDKTTVAEVAEAASVSRATVFWHFSDKRSLFREAFSRLVEPFRQSVERDMSNLPPLKRLEEQIALHEDFVMAHQRAMDGFLRWAVGENDFRETVVNTLLDLHQRYVGALTLTVAEVVPSDVDPGPLALGLITAMDGNLLISFFDTTPRRVEQRREAVIALASLIPRREGLDS